MDVEGDAVVSNAVIVSGEDWKIGDLFGRSLGKPPEPLAAGSFFTRQEERAVALSNEENVLRDGDGLALGFFHW